MNPPLWIVTDARTPITCQSLDDLIVTLDDLQRAYLSKSPTSVGISEAEKAFGEGDIIGVGIGIDPTYVVINIKPCDGEFYQSAGDPRAAGTMQLGGFCEPVYMDRNCFVPWPLALQAVREFVEFGRRTASICWHDWSGREVSEEQV